MAMPVDTPCELVRTFPIFAALDEQSCAEVYARGQVKSYAKGELLFLDGDSPKGLFLIRTGMVKIFKESEQGREQILALLRAGDSVAELPLFDNAPYPAAAAAMEDTTVLFIPKASLDTLLAQNPQLSQAIISALAHRMRTLVELVVDLSLRQVRQRLAHFLLAEAAGRTSFTLSLTNEELAARLGSVRDVISRTLSGLQADRMILLQGRHVQILNVDRLEEEAG